MQLGFCFDIGQSCICIKLSELAAPKSFAFLLRSLAKCLEQTSMSLAGFVGNNYRLIYNLFLNLQIEWCVCDKRLDASLNSNADDGCKLCVLDIAVGCHIVRQLAKKFLNILTASF
jgi:hypothetical protein